MKNFNNQGTKKTLSVFQTITGYFLVIFFAFYSIAGSDWLRIGSEINSFTAFDSKGDPRQPADHPLESDPVPSQFQDEKDLEDSLDDELSKAFTGYEQRVRYRVVDNFSFSQHARSIQNRTTISLFVLHHAWKSSIF